MDKKLKIADEIKHQLESEAPDFYSWLSAHNFSFDPATDTSLTYNFSVHGELKEQIALLAAESMFLADFSSRLLAKPSQVAIASDPDLKQKRIPQGSGTWSPNHGGVLKYLSVFNTLVSAALRATNNQVNYDFISKNRVYETREYVSAYCKEIGKYINKHAENDKASQLLPYSLAACHFCKDVTYPKIMEKVKELGKLLTELEGLQKNSNIVSFQKRTQKSDHNKVPQDWKGTVVRFPEQDPKTRG
jgi:hypothetical protein